MSKRQIKYPTTKYKGENLIPRKQDDFGAGSFFDTPNSEIPANGIKQSINMHVYDTYAEGRAGSKELAGQTSLPILRSGYNWEKDGNIITADAGTFLSTDLNNYVVHDDGSSDQIVRYISDQQVEVDNSTDRLPSTNGKIEGAINAQTQHPTERKIILHIDTRLFLADAGLSEWTEVTNSSRESLKNSPSKICFMDEHAIVINSGGMFKVRMDVPIMWKINSNIPTKRIIEQGSDSGSNYGYNYIYSMGRFRGANKKQNRGSYGVLIEQETGTIKISEQYEYADYSPIWRDNAISENNSITLGELHIPYCKNLTTYREMHYTHYPIYRSLDIGFHGTDSSEGGGNNPEYLAWLFDLPVASTFTAYKEDSQVIATQGIFILEDVGSVIEFQDGDRYEIVKYIDETHVIVEKDYYYYDDDKSPQSAMIGNGQVLTLSQTGNTITQESGQMTISSDDIGALIFWCDGSYSTIADVSGGVITTVEEAEHLSQGAGIYPTYRMFTDYLSDDSLQDRLNSSYLWLERRFFRPLPEANIGDVCPGFLITAQKDTGHIYYSQLTQTKKYYAGMYFPGEQEDEQIEDSILYIKALADRIIYGCRSSHWGTTSNVVDINDSYPGAYIAKLSQTSIINKTIGCLDPGTIQLTDEGGLVMITNENGIPGCRVFNGESFSMDLSIDQSRSRKYVKDVLAGVFAKFASAYIDGEYIVWGIE